jgi:hypothetical protein
MSREEIEEYFSRDIEFDYYDFDYRYEPPYPLTEGERKLLVLNTTGGISLPDISEEMEEIYRELREDWNEASTWVQMNTQEMVEEELTRARAYLAARLDHDIINGKDKDGS